MTDTIELTIGSKFDFIEIVSSVTKGATELSGFDEDTSNWIELAVRESVINAIKHGNREADDLPVDVTYSLDPTALTILVRDRGRGFDLAKVPDPLDPENLLNPNGRGIFYMKSFMDEVEFSKHPDGGTIVRMTKRQIHQDGNGKGETGSDGPSID